MEHQYEDYALSEALWERISLEERHDTNLLLGDVLEAEKTGTQLASLNRDASDISIAATVLAGSINIEDGKISSVLPLAVTATDLRQLTCDFNHGIENNALKSMALKGKFDVIEEITKARMEGFEPESLSVIEFIGKSNLEALKMQPDYFAEIAKNTPYHEPTLKEAGGIVEIAEKLVVKYGIEAFSNPEKNQELFNKEDIFEYKSFADAEKQIKNDFEKFANYVAADLMGESYSNINTVEAHDAEVSIDAGYDARQSGNNEMVKNAGGTEIAKAKGMDLDRQ